MNIRDFGPLFIVVFTLFLIPRCNAQFGIKLGILSSKQSIEFLGTKIISPGKTGAQLGIDYKLPLTESIFFNIL